MSWHYRIRKRILGKIPWFDIVEYYPDPLNPGPLQGWTKDSIAPESDTEKGLIEELERMLADAKKYPVLLDKEK